MSKWIDADSLIEEIASIYGFSISSVRCSLLGSVIANAPTIEPKRGEWTKEKRVYGVSKPFCSRCGAVALSEMINLGSYKTCESNFCPNCGADMREREGE